MELTPEDRERIFQDELAKRQARAAAAETTVGDPKPASTSPVLGCLAVLGALTAIVFGLAMFGVLTPKKPAYVNESVVLARLDAAEDITRLRALRVVDQVTVYYGGVAVVVGPDFSLLPFDQKQEAMAMISRAAGPNSGGDYFIIYSYLDNKKVGAWRGTAGLHLE